MPAPSSISTFIPAEGRTTASVTTSRITPITSSAPARREVTRSPLVVSLSPPLEQSCAHTENDVAKQSLTTPQTDIQPLIPENAFLHERHSRRDNFREVLDAAATNLRRTPPANTSKMQLRHNTLPQRKTQPLFTSYLPDIITNYNSPERKISKQSDAKRISLCTKT